jgi:hypothetical protein
VAFYFAFLVSYTRFLLPIGLVGALCFQLGWAYSVTYSSLLNLWAITFVEYWRIRERIFSVRWGTQGIFRVEKRRASYMEGTTWWHRELRTLASVPVILFFAALLFGLLTVIFVFEAFVTTLYTGPGHEYVVCPHLHAFGFAISSENIARAAPSRRTHALAACCSGHLVPRRASRSSSCAAEFTDDLPHRVSLQPYSSSWSSRASSLFTRRALHT